MAKENKFPVRVKYVNLGLRYDSLRREILDKVDKIGLSGNYILSDEVNKFEKDFAELCQTKYALGVGNGTDALTIILHALNFKQGEEVITVPHTFIATAGSIVAAGMKPVFVDVREDYNMDPSRIESKITKKTRAIIPVHFTGKPADMEPILRIAKKNNLQVIEDSAQAVGAEYNGQRVGSFGVASAFSLHPLKNLHALGDAGAITTNDSRLYESLRRLRNHGLMNRDECASFGYNSRLDEIQAGILNIQLEHVEEWTNRRREIAQRYREGISEIIRCPIDRDDEMQVYHTFVVRHEKRDELQKFLLSKGIETRVHYPIPVHLQMAGKDLEHKVGDFPIAEALAKDILSLPVYPELKDAQVDYVIKQINNYVDKLK